MLEYSKKAEESSQQHEKVKIKNREVDNKIKLVKSQFDKINEIIEEKEQKIQ